MTFSPPPPSSEGRARPGGDESFLPPVPDSVDLVVETATMMSVFAAQRLARIDAMRREALAEAAGRGVGVFEIVERSIRLELATAMRITEHAAGRLIVQAEALMRRYPGAWEALSEARITEKHAEIFVDLVDRVDPALHPRIVARGLELAESEPVGTFRRALRDLIATVEASTLEDRFRTAIQSRRVWVETAADGMGLLQLHGPAVEVQAIFGRITAMAKVIMAAEGETRSLDQVRADILADLLIDGTTDYLPDAASGIRASVVVTVPVLSLLDAPPDDNGGACDSDSTAAGGADTAVGLIPAREIRPENPPIVEGLGPIPISAARELCGGDTKWMRVLTHPETGMVLSVGRDKYEPPAALRRLVKWRADRCMAPGCGMPASRCQIDHQIRWMDGGHTSLENNAPFCEGHHHLKDNSDWVVTQIPGGGGAIEWISPAGRRYVVQPERKVPVFTVPEATTTGSAADAPF